jgi:hypothetical protein
VDTTVTLVGALLGGGAALLSAWALVVKARGEAAKPKQLLHRLWDWIEGNSLHTEVPHTLASEIREEIEGPE